MLRNARVPTVSLCLFFRPLKAVLRCFTSRRITKGGGSDGIFGVEGRVRRIAFERERLLKVLSRCSGYVVCGKLVVECVHVVFGDAVVVIHFLPNQNTEKT